MSYTVKNITITGSTRSPNSVIPVPYYISMNGAASSSCSIPAHQAGDLIIAIAWRTSTPIPSYPGGDWVPVANFTSGIVRSASAYLVSDGSPTSVTFTNATATTVKIYRGCDTVSPIQGSNAWAYSDTSIIKHAGISGLVPDALVTSSCYNLTVANSIFNTQSQPGTEIRSSTTSYQIVDTTIPVSELALYQAGTSSTSYKVTWAYGLKGLT